MITPAVQMSIIKREDIDVMLEFASALTSFFLVHGQSTHLEP